MRSRGNARAHTVVPDFAAFLDDQIRYAEAPAVQRGMCALLAVSGRQWAQAAGADIERVSRLLEELGGTGLSGCGKS